MEQFDAPCWKITFAHRW